MTPTPWTLDPAALLAVLPAASHEEARPLLCGVFLRPDGVAVATNGHLLAARRAAHTVPVSVVLGAVKPLTRFLKEALKRQEKALAPVTLTLLDSGEGVPTARIECDGQAITVPVIGGSPTNPYPRWQATCPVEGTAISRVRLDADALGALGGCLTLHFTSETRAVVLTRDDDPLWYGLLMPCRSSGTGMDPWVLAWTHDARAEEAPTP